MARRRHLAHAPIVEALLDIRVVPPKVSKVETLARLENEFAPDYVKGADRREGEFLFRLDAAVQGSAQTEGSSTHVGYVYTSKDKRRVVQALLGEFTQNFVGGYSNFEVLAGEARKNWEKYLAVYQPETVSRIALRYINDLTLPPDMTRFEDYLAAGPTIPEGVSQGVNDFLYRMTIGNPAIDAVAIVIQLFQGQIDKNGIHVILDIDAIVDKQMDARSPEIWDRFGQLRDFKNDIFFGYTTDKLIERFE